MSDENDINLVCKSLFYSFDISDIEVVALSRSE